MNVLVTVASKHGSSEEIGRRLAAVLAENGLQSDFRKPAEVDSVDDYDAVVVGSAVYVGRWLQGAEQFIERHLPAHEAKPVWLFSSGPLDDPPHPTEAPVDAAPLSEKVGSFGHRVFSGKLDQDGLGLGERATVKLVRAPYGDFRPWPETESWAREVAASLTRSDEGGR